MWIHWPFFPKTWTKGHWPLDDLWPHVCWGHMCDSTKGSSKSHGNTSMYVDTVINFANYHIHTLPHTYTYYVLRTYYVQNEWSQTRQLLNSVQARQLLNSVQARQLLNSVQARQLLNSVQARQLLNSVQARQERGRYNLHRMFDLNLESHNLWQGQWPLIWVASLLRKVEGPIKNSRYVKKCCVHIANSPLIITLQMILKYAF